MNIIGHKIIAGSEVIDTLTNNKASITLSKVISWSYHKQNIVALGLGNEIQLWTERKPNEWQMAVSFNCHKQPIIHLSWAPYDVMFASIDSDFHTLIHNKKQDSWDAPIALENKKYKVVAFAQNKGTMAAGGAYIDIYENLKLVHSINLAVSHLAYSFTDRLLAVSENSISIFDRNVLRQHILLETIPNQVTWSISGSRIFVQIGDDVLQYVENLYNEFVLQ